ncbi:HES5 factor, partial [Amia calva]|nr:HES5 factor [Amia calva]
QIRKPVVEKMRRDRINSSIEHLKALLQKQFQQQQPNSKLEKADILEMTVGFLKEQAGSSATLGYEQGFSQCLQETLRYLSLHAPQQAAERRAMELLYGLQKRAPQSRLSSEQLPTSPPRGSAKAGASRSRVTLWRPW